MILDFFRLSGKTALVTGANTGLGQAISIALAQAGAHVIGIARRSCEETAQMINNDHGCFHEITVDLNSLDAAEIILKQTNRLTDHVDILVNNAGIILREDAVDVSPDDWNRVIYLNQTFVFLLSQSIAREFFFPQQSGKIINIASMLSFQGGIRVPAYTASKSAIVGLTKALANEWASKNIQVNAIAPGYMETNNTTQLRTDSERSQSILERIPAGRWGKAEDIMGAAVYLSSHASDYVNGFTLAVDGGWLAR